METPIPAKPDEASKECKESIMENIKIDLEPEWFTNLLSAFEQKAEGILVALEKATDDKMLAQDGLEILGHIKAQETLFQFLLNTFPSYEKADGYHQTWWKMYEKMWDWSAKCME